MKTGSDIVTLALDHVGEDYVFGALVPKDDPKWHGPWDCAEFCSWAVYQVSQRLYGCDYAGGDPAYADAYTGYWGRDARTMGEVVGLEKAIATPGAFLLRTNKHIAISQGNGQTVEAMGRQYGVVEGEAGGRHWDMGILIPWIDYHTGPAVQPVLMMPTIYRLTTPRTAGDEVLEIQRALLRSGSNPVIFDGIYGIRTVNAVIKFQEMKGLVVDGEVGPQTLRALGVR